jgi:hypothetical protein
MDKNNGALRSPFYEFGGHAGRRGSRGSRRVISTKGVLLPILSKGLCCVGHPVSDLAIEPLNRRFDWEPFVVTPRLQLFHSNQEWLALREFQELKGCS